MEEKEYTPEELAAHEAKMKKLKAKMDVFMAEIGEEMLDEAVLAKTKEHTLKLFQNNGIRFSRDTLRAFIEGGVLVLGSHSDPQAIIHVLMAQKVILKKMDDQIKEQADKSMANHGNGN